MWFEHEILRFQGIIHERKALMLLSYFTTLLLVLFISEIYFVPSLLSLDFLVHQWIQEQRSCSLDTVAVVLQDWTRSQLIVPIIVVLAGAGLLYSRRWHQLLRFFVLVGVGALICELAKFFVIRPRPSVLPFVSDGNSFPSGHVANSLLLLAGAYSTFRGPRRVKKWLEFTVAGVIVAAILVIAWQRLYLGRHWFTDVIGGLFLGCTWLCFVMACWRQKKTSAACVASGLLLTTGFLLLWLVPSMRIRLPSPLTARNQPLARVDFASLASKDLRNDHWSAPWEELGKPIRTMSQRESSVYVRLPRKTDYILALGIRPTVNAKTHSCNRMEVFLNARPLKELTLHEGWRDYNILAPKEKVIVGLNEVTFRLSAAEAPPGIFMYLEAFRRGAFVANIRASAQPALSMTQ